MTGKPEVNCCKQAITPTANRPGTGLPESHPWVETLDLHKNWFNECNSDVTTTDEAPSLSASSESAWVPSVHCGSVSFSKLRRRTLRIPPFQQKRDAHADENEWPDPRGVDMDHVQAREQEHEATDQK